MAGERFQARFKRLSLTAPALDENSTNQRNIIFKIGLTAAVEHQ